MLSTLTGRKVQGISEGLNYTSLRKDFFGRVVRDKGEKEAGTAETADLRRLNLMEKVIESLQRFLSRYNHSGVLRKLIWQYWPKGFERGKGRP